MPRYQVEFIREGRVERAHEDKGKGGFRVEVIPVGTIKEVNDASLNFWRARDCVKLISKIEEPLPPPAFAPFGNTPGPVPALEPKPMTKGALSAALEEIKKTLVEGPAELAAAALARLNKIEIDETLLELGEDPQMVLYAAIDDAKNGEGILGNPNELLDALLDAIDVLLPPSRRKRTHPGARQA